MLMFILAIILVAGCASNQDKAIDQAKKEAAKTGQPQQVVSVDKNGTTTTTIVQPPAPGQTAQATTTTTAPPPTGAPAPAPAEPKVTAVPQPPAPVSVTIPAGTNLAIRVDQRISVKTSRAGDTFTGEVVSPVSDADGNMRVPKGSPVGGIVDAAHKRGRFKGSSVLQLRLTSLTLNGTQYSLKTRDLAETKKGKGKRSAAMIGGGAGLGMLIGGIASGGTGLLIGGLAGGGAGTAAAGLTGNKDLDIPAESIVHFKLSEDLVVQR
jgi:biopolymer transport protein ExbD